MTDEPKEDPSKKLRKLLGSQSPLSKLPKVKSGSASFLPASEDDKDEDVSATKAADVHPKPVKIVQAPASTTKLKTASAPNGRKSFFGPAFWTAASILSLTVNLILIIVLIVLGVGLSRLGLTVSSMLNMGTELLGGLYGNFEKMDRAHIRTTIEVNTTIPVQFDLQLNQQTDVVLSQDVTINNALVTVNTGGLNITRANTTIVLPQGTILPILLNLTVPVDTTVPISIIVPVDIPLAQTELHEPFSGLQDVVRPFYCMINPSALNLDGNLICR
jgi:hypothetical protein